MNKKILIVTQKVDQADSILGFFHRWIEEFAKNYTHVSVICLEEGKHVLPQNVSVYSLGKTHGSTPSFFSRIVRIARFYRYVWSLRHQYDVVFVHMNPIYVVLGGGVWRLLGKRIALWYTHKHVDTKLRLAERLSHVVFTASKESFRLKSTKLHVMGHGIDTEMFVRGKNAPVDMLKVTTTGRISSVKQCDVMIRSIELLRDAGVPVVFDIVGGAVTPEDVMYESNLRSYVVEKKLDDVIHFLGSMSHSRVAEYLPTQHIFINLSRTGSLDKAVLEAMSCGLMILTSNEAFEPMLGKYGCMIQSNDPKNIARLLREVYDRSDNLPQIGDALRAIIETDHQLSSLIRRIATIYETSR